MRGPCARMRSRAGPRSPLRDLSAQLRDLDHAIAGARSAPVAREAAPSALADTLLVAARAGAIADIWVIGE